MRVPVRACERLYLTIFVPKINYKSFTIERTPVSKKAGSIPRKDLMVFVENVRLQDEHIFQNGAYGIHSSGTSTNGIFAIKPYHCIRFPIICDEHHLLL